MNYIVSNVVTPRVNFRANTPDDEKNVAFKENPMVVTKQADNGAKILLGLSALATTAVAAVALVKNKKITGEVKNLTEKLRKTETVNTELVEKVKNLEAEAQKVAKKAEEKAKKSRPVRNYYSYDTNYYTKPEKENVFTRIKDWFSDNVFIRKTSNKSRKVHKNRKPNIFTKIKNKFSSNTRRTQRGQGTQRTQKANIFDKVNNWFVEQKNAFSTKKLERSEKRAARKAEKARQKAETPEVEKKTIFSRLKDRIESNKFRSIKQLESRDGYVYNWRIGNKGCFDKVNYWRNPESMRGWGIRKGASLEDIESELTERFSIFLKDENKEFVSGFIKEVQRKSRNKDVEIVFFTKK